MSWRLAASFRSRVLLLTITLALVPLALVGWWLQHSALQSGERLLRTRLFEGLELRASDIRLRYVPYRAAMLSLAEHGEVQRTPSEAGNSGGATNPPAAVQPLLAVLDPAFHTVHLLDSAGKTVWIWNRGAPMHSSNAQRPLLVDVQVYGLDDARNIGSLVAHLDLAALFVGTPQPDIGSGSVLAAIDADSGLVLTSVPFEPGALNQARFRWGGEDWLTARVSVREPALDLVAAGPMTPFLAPLQAAARQGLMVLSLVAALALGVALLLTARLTRSLESLAESAASVAAGDLRTRAALPGDDEIARVGQAFDAMTQNLERTLKDSARKESLAAVGSFASELAHEVRNPLTAIRVDLQLIGERLDKSDPLMEVQQGALDQVRELETTVTGILQLARSGNVEFTDIDVLEPVNSAIRAALPEFQRRCVLLETNLPEQRCVVRGDTSALRQVFLNVLLNAVQAVSPGGRVNILAEVTTRDITIAIRDDGPGMTAQVLSRVTEPFVLNEAGRYGTGAFAQRTYRTRTQWRARDFQ